MCYNVSIYLSLTQTSRGKEDFFMKFYTKLTILFLCCLLLGSISASAKNISIGLKFGAKSPQETTVQNSSGFLVTLGDEVMSELNETKVTVKKNEDGTASVIHPEDGTVLCTYEKSDQPLGLCPKDSGTVLIDGSEYRGSARFLLNDTGLTVINYVDLEDYLKGVVPGEMPHSWPTEALKAQAVCARNFALTNWNKFQKYGFNLDDTTQSQVYLGVKAEKPESNRAVEETENIFLTYNGEPATTFFYSSSGGHTESSKYVWGGDYPYLIGVEDPYDTSREWTVPYTPDEIEEKLAGINVNIGDVTDLEVIERSPSGRIIDLKIIGTTGTYHAKLEKSRSLFNLRSNLFTITETGGEIQPTTVITARGLEDRQITQSVITATGIVSPQVGTPSEYIFQGTGYGHGVGMSQYGAKGMAEQGYNFEQILTHYFAGTVLTEMPAAETTES